MFDFPVASFQPCGFEQFNGVHIGSRCTVSKDGQNERLSEKVPCCVPTFLNIWITGVLLFFDGIEQRNIVEWFGANRTPKLSISPVSDMLSTHADPNITVKEEYFRKGANMRVSNICIKQERIPIEREYRIFSPERKKKMIVNRRFFRDAQRGKIVSDLLFDVPRWIRVLRTRA